MINRKSSARRLTAVMSLLLVLAAGRLSLGQVRIPDDALVDQAQVQQALEHGQQLEQKQLWREAFSHYEKALRDYPDQQDLQGRLTLARIHLDVSRRYGDPSFVDALWKTTEHEALDLYSEVMLKIQAYYVDPPNWNGVVGRGTETIDVALSEAVFAERHLRGVAVDRVEAARRELHQAIDARVARNRHEALDLVSLAARILSARLGLAPQVVIQEYTCGAIGALDVYSSYLTADQYNEVMSQIDGNFVGLGIELKAQDEALLIVDVIRQGPAEQAGIQGGDRIVEVDGRSTKDLTTDKAADMLRGAEGSTVDVKVVATNGEARFLRLQRRRVEIPSLDVVKIIDRDFGIGYIKLTTFQRTSLRDFNAALWQLHREGMRSLIVDVRGNPGGLLDASVDVADKFVSSGTIVSTRGRNPREDADHTAKSFGTWQVPLVVLIDGDSASASEIFAGAIQDHRRGTVVGHRSYGKGSVQGIFPLNGSQAGIRLTTAKFYSPNGHPISGRGVSPDVAVRDTAKPVVGGDALTSAEDAILNSGLQVSRQQLSRR